MKLEILPNYPESTKGYHHKKKADKLASARIIINADKFSYGPLLKESSCKWFDIYKYKVRYYSIGVSELCTVQLLQGEGGRMWGGSVER